MSLPELLPATLVQMGYSYKIFAQAGTEIIFEPDEERHFRPVVDAGQGVDISVSLFAAIAQALEKQLRYGNKTFLGTKTFRFALVYEFYLPADHSHTGGAELKRVRYCSIRSSFLVLPEDFPVSSAFLFFIGMSAETFNDLV